MWIASVAINILGSALASVSHVRTKGSAVLIVSGEGQLHPLGSPIK